MLDKAYSIGALAAITDFSRKLASLEESTLDPVPGIVESIEEITVGLPDDHKDSDHYGGNQSDASSPSTKQTVQWSSPRVLRTGRP